MFLWWLVWPWSGKGKSIGEEYSWFVVAYWLRLVGFFIGLSGRIRIEIGCIARDMFGYIWAGKGFWISNGYLAEVTFPYMLWSLVISEGNMKFKK